VPTRRPSAGPTRIKLSDERRAELVAMIQHFVRRELDQELSEFQAERLLDFFVRHLGAPVYNQAIQDVRSFLQEKVGDLDVEFYEPEEPRR
jgi:uncharacterized protein (DUF2164 family)